MNKIKYKYLQFTLQYYLLYRKTEKKSKHGSLVPGEYADLFQINQTKELLRNSACIQDFLKMYLMLSYCIMNGVDSSGWT